MSLRKTRNALSVAERIKLIKNFDESGLNQADFAKQKKIPVSTFRTILGKRKSLEEAAYEGNAKKKKLKVGKYADLEELLTAWIKQARASHIPINGPVVREKALEIAKKLNIEKFTASLGWFSRFQERKKISFRAICGESESVSEEEVSDWTSTVLPSLIKGYELKDIFNADEFGLFFKLLPDKSLVLPKETCHGGKLSKERLTVLVGANADGSEKLDLLVIGKSKKPRCFKNIKTFPCEYSNSKKAWMTGERFEKWLKDLDKKFIKKKRKIVLLIDNCPAHPKEVKLENVKVIFFPPNCTSRLQPMDMGIIRTLKHYYRKRLVEKYLNMMEKEGKKKIKIEVLDAMCYLKAAWDMVTEKTISNCFKKSGIILNDSEAEKAPLEPENLNDPEWELIQSNETFQHYVTFDDDLLTCKQLTLEEMIEELKENEAEEDFESDVDSDEEEEEPIMTKREAIEAVHQLKKFLMAQASSEETLQGLSALEKNILQSDINLRQSVVTDYFKHL